LKKLKYFLALIWHRLIGGSTGAWIRRGLLLRLLWRCLSVRLRRWCIV